MRPYCIPLSKEVIVETAMDCIDQFEICPEIATHHDFVKAQIANAFASPRLPDVFQDKRQLANCMFYRSSAPTLAIAEHCDLDLADVSSYRAEICTQIALLFYQSYIQEALKTLLIPYCQTHTPPLKHWGVCSIFYWDDEWGRAFYSFWKNNIEKNGDDIFREQILPHLPKEWLSSYKPQNPACFCPHIWPQMNDNEIVAVLCSLERSVDPTNQQWGIGALANWKDPVTKAHWGKSFWHYWRSCIETDDEKIFRERMLPKFPEAWQKNFKPMEFTHWRGLPNIEIANILEISYKPLGIGKWGLGSMCRWTSRGRSLANFTHYWRRSVEGAGEDAIFRRDILPLLSDTLQKTYRPVGYTMPLRKFNDEDSGSVESIEDPDSLYELADNGNQAAFLKIKRILILHVVSQLSHLDLQMDLLDQVIERVVHMHRPFLGKITAYAITSVRNFFGGSSWRLVLSGSDPTRRNRASSGFVKDTVETSAVESIDAKNRIQNFQSELIRQGFHRDRISHLFNLLIDGISLNEIITSDDPYEYRFDDDLIRVARALASITSSN